MGQFSYGNDIFNYNLFTVLSGSNDSNNGLVDWNRRWRSPGDITDVPKPTPSNLDNATVSSRFVEDGSFLRLRNITLGYTLPRSGLTVCASRACVCTLPCRTPMCLQNTVATTPK